MKTICKKDIQAMKELYGLTESELQFVKAFSDCVNVSKPFNPCQSYFGWALLRFGNLNADADAAVKAILIYIGAKINKENDGRYGDTIKEIARKLKCSPTKIGIWIDSIDCDTDRFGKHVHCGTQSGRNVLEIA
jgi:hypothetical protein